MPHSQPTNYSACLCELKNCHKCTNNVPKLPKSSKRFEITTIVRQTRDTEIEKILSRPTRVIHIRLAYGTADEHEQLMLKINNAIQNRSIIEKHNRFKTPIALAIEIRGHVRIGRFRNNEKYIKLKQNQEIALTSNENYRNYSVKEIVYLSMFDDYIDALKIDDYIFVNRSRVQLKIIKIVKTFKIVYCQILTGGTIKPYARVTLPYFISNTTSYSVDELHDCKFAMKHNADFVVIPSVQTAEYVMKIKSIFHTHKLLMPQIFATIDKYTLLGADKTNLKDIVEASDGLWFENYSKSAHNSMAYVVSMAADTLKPILCVTHQSVCPKCRWKNRFIHYQQITISRNDGTQDIEKRINSVANVCTPCGTNSVALASFLLKTKVVIAITKTGRIPIYMCNAVNAACQVIAITDCDETARKLSIWKNVLPIVYPMRNVTSVNDYEVYIQFGLEYAKMVGLADVGDVVGYCFDGNEDRIDEKPSVFRVVYVN